MSTGPDGGGAQRWSAETGRGKIGPQGAALILELQRLQSDFDHRQADAAAGAAADKRPPDARRRPPPRRRQRRGLMGRAIAACLQHFGYGDAGRDARPSPPPVPAIAPSGRAASNNTARELIARVGGGIKAGAGFLTARNDAADEKADDALVLRVGRAFDRELRAGLRVLIVAVAIAGGWAVLMPLSGAVVVAGNLVVKSTVKKIQHLTGGIVAEIAVHDGMRVDAGDLLVRLDATQARANLQVVSQQLDEVRTRIARLLAERDDLAQLALPPDLTARSQEDGVKALMASEETLFRARATTRKSQKELLQSRVAQLNEEITGLDAQIKSKAEQLELIESELKGLRELYEKKLVPLTRVISLQREMARIGGERGQLISSIAETKAKIGEAQLQIVRVDHDFRADVVKDLNEAQSKQAELAERSIAARDLLDHIEIRAPTAGVVHQLAVHTIGGVIRAGETVMEIVPETDDLQIEAKLQPGDIDQVHAGQTSFVRFSAFNQRTTPQLTGIVSYVSADISRDQQTNTPYFTVRVTLPEDERRRLAGLQLVSGMPAELFMQTGSRTMMSYLFKPVTDQLNRAFIER